MTSARISSHVIVIATSIVTLAIVVLATLHIYDYALDVDRVVAADNIMTIVCQLFIATAVMHLLWQRCELRFWKNPLDISLAGMMVEPIGWIFHRSYWAVWRISRAMGEYEMADSMEGASALLTAIGVAFIALGAIMVANPYSRRIFGEHWLTSSIICLVAVWILAYQIPDLLLAMG